MRRILLLIKGLGRGGAERLLVSSARYADKDRFAYEVAYLLPWKDALVPDLQGVGVPVHCLKGARGVGWVGRLRSLVLERRIELVHGHSPYPMVGARLALPRSCRLVYTEHNLWSRYHPATYWANLVTYPRNDHVFAVSEQVRLSARYPVGLGLLPMPAIETLHHGPDPEVLSSVSPMGVREELGLPEGVPVVGTVANLKPHKGLQHLLLAAKDVRRAVPDARFVVVGQGPLLGELRDRAGELGLDGAVVFTGYRDDAVRVASSFDVFVLSSLHEGLSIALVEAMALGKPVVVTAVGGLPEVVANEQQGLVVPAADAGALARGIVSLLSDDARRLRLGSAARLRAAQFDIQKAVRRVEDVYEELLR